MTEKPSTTNSTTPTKETEKRSPIKIDRNFILGAIITGSIGLLFKGVEVYAKSQTPLPEAKHAYIQATSIDLNKPQAPVAGPASSGSEDKLKAQSSEIFKEIRKKGLEVQASDPIASEIIDICRD